MDQPFGVCFAAAHGELRTVAQIAHARNNDQVERIPRLFIAEAGSIAGIQLIALSRLAASAD
jgi:hypothetical protein